MQRLKYAVFAALCLIFILAGSLGIQASEVLIESWVARYDGPGNGSDNAWDMAVDAMGNVYVTGWSLGIGPGHDYTTIKYDTDGNQLWVARYPDGAAWALAVEGDGNVYVTGRSAGIGTYDYATIKYDTDGNQLWAARHNGPGNGADVAYDLALDEAGNVYVTGWSAGIGTSSDYATVKYDIDGNQLWVAHYNGPGNSHDRATALVVDQAANVYVTGASHGIGTSFDYATIKYDAAGNEVWVRRYNGPVNGNDYAHALAADGGGNVYVTGYSWGSGMYEDYATIKYDADGNEVWVARYDGPGNGDDGPYALAVDGGGNVYVTGYSWGIGTDWDCATIKYDANGNEVWVRRHNGSGNGDDSGYVLAVDGLGNVYVAGWLVDSDTSYDNVTIKYSTDGTQLWIAHYNGPGNYWDWVEALALDGLGNVYVTGPSYGSTGYDYATIKYATTPAEAIEHLTATVEDMNLAQGIDNNLDAKLQAVQDALVAANADLRNDAVNKLEAFINAVEAQRGTKLTDAEADQLVNAADDIISALGETTAAPTLVRVSTSGPQLEQNYPNPFNPETWIPYRLKEGADVIVSIYSATGQLVRRLDLGYRNAGSYTSMEKAVHWDGRNQYAERTSSGIYFYTIQAGEFAATKKMIIAQ